MYDHSVRITAHAEEIKNRIHAVSNALRDKIDHSAQRKTGRGSDHRTGGSTDDRNGRNPDTGINRPGHHPADNIGKQGGMDQRVTFFSSQKFISHYAISL